LKSRALPRRAFVAILAVLTASIVSPGPSGTAARARARRAEVRTLSLSAEDTSLRGDQAPDSGESLLGAGTGPDGRVAGAVLLKFELTDLPAGAVVEDARLYLALVDSDRDAETTYALGAHKVVTRAVGSALESRRLSRAHDRQAIDTRPGYKSWTLTRMVQEWQADPATNLGVVLQPDAAAAADHYRLFASAEYADAALRPVLRVSFTDAAATLTLAPQDTFLNLNANNYAGNVQLGTYTWPDYRVANAILMKFDLSALPPGAVVQQATLHLALVQSDTNPEPVYTVAAHKVIGKNADPARATGYTTDGVTGWTPNACCQDGVPLAQKDLSPAYDTRQIDKAVGYKVWMLTGMVQEWLADPASNFGVLLNSDTSLPRDHFRFFASTESPDAALRPFLRIQYALPPERVLLAPEDTFLNLDDVNYSAQTRLRVYTWPHQQVANTTLMKFDLSSLPAGAVVDEALLHLYLAQSDAKPDRTYRITAHKVLGRSPTVAAATGYRASGTATWTPNTCCYQGVPMAQADISSAYDARDIDKTPGYKVWNVTAMVRDWLASPATNRGLLLDPDVARTNSRARASDTKDRFRYFASAEEPDAGRRPFLRVSYRVPGSSDTTPPSVGVTAPAAAATVSGTVTVTASATDNVSVAGVQFKRDGVNLGAEDTTAPYAVSWDTSGVANGSHTLTAVARDAAGNVATSAAVAVTVANAAPPGGLAARYPGDVGLEADPDVVFVERFEQATLGELFTRWTDILGGSSMSFDTDVPAGSPGARSINIPWVGGGVSDGGHLYKLLGTGLDDTVYVRYYIKYPTTSTYDHSGIWMGGSNPPLSWPNPQAGTRPAGNDRFIAAAEQNTQTSRFDHYDYWMNMHPSADGNYWGNLLLNNAGVRAKSGQWMCVEQMVKLNNPTTTSNGEHAIWLDGVKVSHLGLGFPNGRWSGGIFTQDPTGTPFEGFRWRSDANLKLNWIWLQAYAPGDPAGFTASIKFDHVVVAKSYIGCLAAGAGDTVAPTVSLTAPAAGAIVSGSAVTVAANAADDVGVAGVQFKLNGANLGTEDTAPPWSVSWNTTSAPNGAATLSAVARDAAGNLATASAVTVTVGNGTATSWPNKPAGFVTLNDQPWNQVVGNGWNYLRRTASKDATIATDATAPLSPANALRMIFTTDMPANTEPGVHWMSLPGVREVYTGWWIKMSPNWSCSPAGCGKMTFLFASGGANVYTTILNPDSGLGPPFRVGMRPQWGGYDLNFLPNVTTTWIQPGEWRRIEFYFKWETTPGVSGDGIFRWWVDGVLNGNYTNIRYPADSFIEFQYAPTLQNPPPAEQYMYVDHTLVARP
jgi:hypothetical protein